MFFSNRIHGGALALVCLVALAGPVNAESMLVPEAVSVPVRGTLTLRWVVTNDAVEALRVEVKEELPARLFSGSVQSQAVVLRTETASGTAAVPAGGHMMVRYRLEIPVGSVGPLVLEVPGTGAQPVMFSVQNEDDATAASASPSVDGPRRAVVRHETALRRSTRLIPGLVANEPLYFGLGGHSGLNAKFQLSFKYAIFDAQPIYFAFTQTALWDLHSTSKPFRDTAYRPSALLQKENLWVSKGGDLSFGYQGGLEHESNGKGGLDTRTINIGFFRPRFEWRGESGVKVFLAPKFYGYIEKSENPDISDYRGYADVLFGVQYKDWKLSSVLRKGTRGHYGSVQVDAVFPLRQSDAFLARFGLHGLNGYFFVQYFNGWGESILDYRSKLPYQVRAGIMVVP
jgi:hypothetical protein